MEVRDCTHARTHARTQAHTHAHAHTHTHTPVLGWKEAKELAMEEERHGKIKDR